MKECVKIEIIENSTYDDLEENFIKNGYTGFNFEEKEKDIEEYSERVTCY